MVHNEQGGVFNSTGALQRQLFTSHISRAVWQRQSHTEHLQEDLFHRDKKDKDICITSILKLLILICLTNSKVCLSKSEKVFAYLLSISICETTKALTEKEINPCFKCKCIQYTKGLSTCICNSLFKIEEIRGFSALHPFLSLYQSKLGQQPQIIAIYI